MSGVDGRDGADARRTGSRSTLSRWRESLRARRPSGGARMAGGLALARDKPGLGRAIVDVPLPATLVLPLIGHGGRPLVPEVLPGERVARGQRLAPGVLAGADATVVAIEPRPIAHPAGRDAPCIVLATDPRARGTGRAGEAADLATLRPTLPPLAALTLGRLVECGVSGLGGAGFPTPDKLADGTLHPIHTLVVNGAECEPGIACDEALMQAASDEIVAGALALARLVGAARCLLGVESDKPDAAAALREALRARAPDGESPETRLVEVAPRYPSGAERLLIRLLTGVDVPPGERPARHGVLCVNVGTARAAHRARLGEPLLERVLTVAGARTGAPCNARVVFGTSLADLLEATAGASAGEPRRPDTRVRVGGPLSGFDVTSVRVPVTATVNRVALEPPRSPSPASPCIRCAACSDVCPVGLLPQELLRHARAEASAPDAGSGRARSAHQRALDRGGLDACLECGCCDLVCPSSIPLTATFRHARGARLDARLREREVARAEALHRRREARLAARGAPVDDDRPPPSPVSGDGDSARADPGATGTTAGIDRPIARTGTVETGGEPPAPDDPVAAALARAQRRRRERRGGDDRDADGGGDGGADGDAGVAGGSGGAADLVDRPRVP